MNSSPVSSFARRDMSPAPARVPSSSSLHEREQVARARERLVEGRLREDDVAEQLVEVAVLCVHAVRSTRRACRRGEEDDPVADLARAGQLDPRGRSRRRSQSGQRRGRALPTRSCALPIVSGSTPLTSTSPPPTSCARSPRIEEEKVTPRAEAAASPAPSGTVSQPVCDVITWLVPSWSRSALVAGE